MRDLNLVALGTSIMWGQGLEDGDKMHAVLCKLLQDRFVDRKINCTFLAHSGSTTGYKPDGSIDTHREARLHGEVPTFYPTILQQIEEIDEHGLDHDAVDIILLDAGINDVSILTILNPMVRISQIEALVEMYCHQHIVSLLTRLTETFKNATILLIGYYQILTEDSEEALIHTLLKAMGLVPGGFLIDKVVDRLEVPLKNRLITNCEAFVTCSLTAFEQSAKEVNSRLTEKRVLVVPSTIDSTHATFSHESWLFGINDDLTPEDSVAATRADACESASLGRTMPLACEKASVCHPNPKGARAYAESILATLVKDGF